MTRAVGHESGDKEGLKADRRGGIAQKPPSGVESGVESGVDGRQPAFER